MLLIVDFVFKVLPSSPPGRIVCWRGERIQVVCLFVVFFAFADDCVVCRGC